MLKRICEWARTIDWIPILAAALILALVLLAIGPLPNQETYEGAPSSAIQNIVGTLSAEWVIAFFTVVIATVGWLTYLTFYRQADIMSEQIQLARDEFNATHRPEITIRAIRAKIMLKEGDEYIGASVDCFNKGRVEATNFIARGQFVRTDRPTSAIGKIIQTRSSVVHKGMGHEFSDISEYTLSDQALADSCKGSQRLFLVGLIQYSNKTGETAGQTGFCRAWNSNKQEWDNADNPELEFEL